MLAEIRITGLGVISEASADLHPGFTALTGETGAGKTMVVTSLHLLAGGRADASRVRTDSPRAVVEGRFSTDGAPGPVLEEIAEVTDSCGAEVDDDGSIIAVRTVGKDGRSRAHLGGRSVPVGTLTQLTSPLLTVHGQNDQLRLLKPGEQRAALDRFGDDTVGPLLDRYRKVRAEWMGTRRELEERTSRSRELAQEADRLTFGLGEIDAVDPQPGEDETIAADVRRLSDLDSLRSAALEAHVALAGGSEYDSESAESTGALELVSAARARLDSADDGALREMVPRLDELLALAADISGDLGSYLAGLPTDTDALEGLLTRQAELKALTRKYAADVDGVLAWAAEARERLAKIDVSADALAELEARVGELSAKVALAAVKLSTARCKAATKLAKAVTAELSGLAMGKARLEVEVSVVEASPGDDADLVVDGRILHAGPHGVDTVEFRLGAHPTADALPIGKTASGGELSRVMLALEVVLAAQGGGTTMVFDEVDAGVGGRAAVEIGRRLAKLSRTHQVIVVTHLPQVAAFADTHLVVDKVDDRGGLIQSGVRALGDDERVVELARMLAGLDDTETGRAHAEELLAAAASARAE
ncbi:DNA repair protein RecN [Rhodococcus sp. D2-41]|uniref:DNA repair protein RecN n=1 Tax=Speluncibacter jeojiensis TaxID=2710754 RepID=UPI00240F104F|nr:DNA repair protein RecN [Rhodococcus sp. D2-41]MDG3012881.1 DNA repair protein RecN [Rhodococcus sp. D2-41]